MSTFHLLRFIFTSSTEELVAYSTYYLFSPLGRELGWVPTVWFFYSVCTAERYDRAKRLASRVIIRSIPRLTEGVITENADNRTVVSLMMRNCAELIYIINCSTGSLSISLSLSFCNLSCIIGRRSLCLQNRFTIKKIDSSIQGMVM